MQDYQLIINPFAEEDLIDSIEWYNNQREGLGTEFYQKIKTILLRINENPFQFPKEMRLIRKAVAKQFPFNIFFNTEENS